MTGTVLESRAVSASWNLYSRGENKTSGNRFQVTVFNL